VRTKGANLNEPVSYYIHLVRREESSLEILDIEDLAFEVKYCSEVCEKVGELGLSTSFDLQYQMCCLLAAECFWFGGRVVQSPREYMDVRFRIFHVRPIRNRHRANTASNILGVSREAQVNELRDIHSQASRQIDAWVGMVSPESPFQTRRFLRALRVGGLRGLVQAERDWLRGLSPEDEVQEMARPDTEPFARLVEAIEDGFIPEEWDWE